jgi:hypothetical protein
MRVREWTLERAKQVIADIDGAFSSSLVLWSGGRKGRQFVQRAVGGNIVCGDRGDGEAE